MTDRFQAQSSETPTVFIDMCWVSQLASVGTAPFPLRTMSWELRTMLRTHWYLGSVLAIQALHNIILKTQKAVVSFFALNATCLEHFYPNKYRWPSCVTTNVISIPRARAITKHHACVIFKSSILMTYMCFCVETRGGQFAKWWINLYYLLNGKRSPRQ